MCSEPSNLKGIYNNSTVKMLKYRSKSSLPDTSFILFFYETIVLFTLQLRSSKKYLPLALCLEFIELYFIENRNIDVKQ